MSCTLNFRVNGKEYVIENVDELENYDLKTVLQLLYKHINEGNNKAVWDELRLSLSGRKSKSESYKDTTGRIVGNHTVASILNKYKYLYEGLDNDPEYSDIKVLLAGDVKSLVNKNLSFGTKLVLNGQELFIIKDDVKSVTNFVNYLKVIKLLRDGKYEPTKEDLDLLKNFPEFNSFDLLLEDFASDNSKYKGEDYYSKLDKIYRTLLGLNERTKYNSDTLTELNSLFTFKYSQGKSESENKTEISIETSLFVNLLLRDEELSELEHLTIKDFFKYYNKPFSEVAEDLGKVIFLSDDQIKSYLETNKSGINVIVDYLASKDRNFTFKFKDATNKKITFDYNNLTLAENFGDIYLKKVTQFTPIKYYKSYGIFSDGHGNYFVSKLFLHSDLKGVKMYQSIDESEKQINLKFTKDKIGLESALLRRIYEGINEIPFKYVGVVSRVLQAPELLKEFKLNVLESNFIQKGDVFTFFKTFIFNEKWATEISLDPNVVNEMKRVLDDSQKIMMLFYLTNRGKSNDTINDPKTKEEILEALEIIDSLNYDYYEAFTTGKSNARSRVKKIEIKDKDNSLSEANSYFYSKANAFDLLKNRLAKYKVKLNILTSDLLVDLFKDIIENVSLRKKNIKAFVHNNEIYINIDTANLDDFAHEYYHILLGVLKTTNEEGYLKLMDKFQQLIGEDIKVSLRYNLIKNQYKNFSEVDQLEETLVDVLGEYVSNGKTGTLKFDEQITRSRNLFEVFDGINDESIFNDEKLQDFLVTDMSLKELLNKLQVFSQGSLSKLEELLPKNSLSLIKQRKLTKYLDLQINKGEIIKRC